MPETITMVPSPRKLMQSLRDVGYDLHTAIADIVDNSIVSRATVVHVRVELAGPNSWVRIADNGQGMTGSELDEALRYGADRDYEIDDLGRFGLGLKIASFSQCQRLTVASRAADSEIEIRCWDLNHVQSVDAWQLLKLRPDECPSEVYQPLLDRPGTIVYWEALDRVLDKLPPDPKNAQAAVDKLCSDVQTHLAMVFHRFLEPDGATPPRLAIFVNGNSTDPWDPFVRSHAKTQRLDGRTLTFEHAGATCHVRVQPYILPNKEHFTSRAFRDAAGPNKWNRQQGFYIYRNHRMIQSGGWNRLRTLDEHTKLARIALDFSSTADDAFKINVSKMSVTIPAAIRNELEKIANDVARAADTVYRKDKPSRPVRPLWPPPPPAPKPPDSQPTPDTGGDSTKPLPHRRPESTVPYPVPTNETAATTATEITRETESDRNKPRVKPPYAKPITSQESLWERLFGKKDGSQSLAESVVMVLARELGEESPTFRQVLQALAQELREFKDLREVK